MAVVRIQEAASHRLDEIYRYTRDRWGAEQDALDRLKTELRHAFAVPETAYTAQTADEVIARNRT